MVSIKWCLEQKNGLELREKNAVMANSYINMAEESLGVLPKVKKSKIWTATAAYYVYYYSLYSVMLRCGVKCEIHTCSLEFMKQCLNELYGEKDREMIHKAFAARKDLQYYSDRPVDDAIIQEVKKSCKLFFIKTKDILTTITEEQTENIRKQLPKENETV